MDFYFVEKKKREFHSLLSLFVMFIPLCFIFVPFFPSSPSLLPQDRSLFPVDDSSNFLQLSIHSFTSSGGREAPSITYIFPLFLVSTYSQVPDSTSAGGARVIRPDPSLDYLRRSLHHSRLED